MHAKSADINMFTDQAFHSTSKECQINICSLKQQKLYLADMIFKASLLSFTSLHNIIYK